MGSSLQRVGGGEQVKRPTRSVCVRRERHAKKIAEATTAFTGCGVEQWVNRRAAIDFASVLTAEVKSIGYSNREDALT
jgi:hypothetical protein